MRVLHVIPSLDLRDGGPSVALPFMARSVTAHDVKVDAVATMTEADAAAQAIRFAEPVPRDGFTARFFKRQTGFYKVSLPLRSWLLRHAREYDVFHIHALFSFAPLAAARAARRAGIPYVIRPLGLLNSWGMENRRRWMKSLSFRLFDRPALARAAAIHYTSEDERAEAARLNLPARSVVIPLGIDPDPFRLLPPAEIFFARFPVARHRDIVLFLSRVDPKKGLRDLLAAFAELRRSQPRALLVIAGSGAVPFVGSLKALCDTLDISRDVLWTGMLEGELKLAALAAARVFVLPSYSENFGIALLEAMASGLACVSTEGVALAKEAGNAVALTHSTPHSLCEILDRLLSSEAARRELGDRAAALVREKYSLDAVGRRLSEMYRDVSGSSGAGCWQTGREGRAPS